MSDFPGIDSLVGDIIGTTLSIGSAAPPIANSIVDVRGSLHVLVTNPTLAPTVTSFAATTINTGAYFSATWQTGASVKGWTLVAESIVEATAPASGAPGAIYGGTYNKLTGSDAFGVLGVMRNLAAITVPSGCAVWAILRGSLGGAGTVDGMRSSSELDTAAGSNHPRAGLLIDSQFAGTAWANGIWMFNIKDYGLRIGAGAAAHTEPTKAIAVFPIAGGETFSVTMAGFVQATSYNASGLSVTGAGTTPLLSVAGTWNTSGSPVAILLDITNTASGSLAALADLRVGGVSRWSVGKGGVMKTNANASVLPAVINGTLFQLGADGTNPAIILLEGDGTSATRIWGRRSGGSFASPSATGAAVTLMNFGGAGYDTTNGYALDVAANLLFQSVSAWTNADHSAQISFATTPVGSVTRATVLTITADGSVQLGGTAARSGTAGTKRIDIFDGTAPTGTLANGIALYSTAGELRVMDAGGVATLLSPHDDAGYWVFDSTDTRTGHRLKIDVERMLRKLNEIHGWDFIQEFAVAA